MTRDEPFLQSIRETPNDDAPRLIYADWLEEQNQADRADFIRLQCRLARLPQEAAERAALTAHTEELLRRNWEEWVGPLREIVGPWRDRYGQSWMGEEYDPQGLRFFQRGFVRSITLEANSFLQHSHQVRLLIPDLFLLGLWGAGGCADALAQSPALEGITILAFLDFYRAPLEAEGAAALAASPYLHGLSQLHLGRNSLGDEGVESLARAPWLASLLWLDLSDNGLSDRAAHALAASSYLNNLRSLCLLSNSLTRAGVAALRSSPNLRRLTEFVHDHLHDVPNEESQRP